MTKLSDNFEKKYNAKEQEQEIMNFWNTQEIYKFDPQSSKVVFSIDTPPPTMSGRMHIGHAFSYAQTDFIARYKRMSGHEVFYPFGTDDNGLATEKIVQKEKNVDLRKMTREEAVKITMDYIEKTRPQFVQDWKNLGISCDFDNLGYSTISPYSQRVSQESFLQLVNKGLIERRKGPIPWDRVFQTTIAQAELEDKEVKSKMNYIKAKVVGTDHTYIIYATTRPEMIFACHGFSVEDSGEYVKLKVNVKGQEEFWIFGAQTYEEKLSKLGIEQYEIIETLKGENIIGERVIIPLINREIEITHDQSIKADLGTGSAYFCSFGGLEDIEYIKRHPGMKIYEIMNRDGTLNELCGEEFNGLIASEEGRFAAMRKLKEIGALIGQENITQIVNVGERSGVPVEYIASEQWFVKYLDKKEMFFEFANAFKWTPEFMKTRLENWIKGLNWDWGFSRQRHFGVPIPAWINTKTNATIYPTPDMLPLDPTSTPIPAELCEEGFSPKDYKGEEDVFDTWFTSASSPQLALNLVEDQVKRNELKLDIPLHKQQDKNDCGASSIQSVLQYFGINKEYDEVLKELNYEGYGIWTPVLAQYLSSKGLYVNFYTTHLGVDESLKELEFFKNNTADFDIDKKEVEEAISELNESSTSQCFEKSIELNEILNKINKDVVACLNVHWGTIKGDDTNSFHYVIISGFDEENVYVMDNVENAHLKIPKDVFDKARKTKGTDEDIIFVRKKQIVNTNPLFPMDLRPQGHDIINFWLFYSMAKNNLIYEKNPFDNVAISGWVLAPDGSKMSKSKENGIDPQDIVSQFSNDALRFAAASNKLGYDSPFQEKEVKTGYGVANKMYNSVKFASMLLDDFSNDDKKINLEELTGVDRAVISLMQHTIKESNEAFEKYDYAKAKSVWNAFFMSEVADNYLEIVKQRLWQKQENYKAAQKTLYLVLFESVKGLAPIMPFITESVYQRFFKEYEQEESTHTIQYPQVNEQLLAKADEEQYFFFTQILKDVRKYKAEQQISMKEPLEELKIYANKQLQTFIENNLQDLRNVTNTENIVIEEGEFKVEMK